MIIRTLRPCEVAGRTVAPGLLLDLVDHQAEALIEAGDAEPTAMQPQPRPAAPAPDAQPQE